MLDRPPGRRADLLAHSHVVDRLAEAGPVMPVRFGSVLADRESVVADVLAADHDHFVALLEDVRGKVQLNLRASYQRDQVLAEVVQSHPEIAELRRRTKDLPEGTMHPDLVRLGELVSHAMEARRVEDAEDVLDVVRPLVVAEAPRTGGGLDHVVSVALLVESEGVAELEERLEELAEAVHERIRLQLTGPGRAVRLRRGAGVGLISGILGLPLAPLRGVTWVAEQVLEQAEEEFYDPARIREQLEEVQRLREDGSLTDEEAIMWEDELIERLMVASERPRKEH